MFQAASEPQSGLQFFGKYKGVVKDNDDKTFSGKLEVMIPDVHGRKLLWAQPCVPYADADRGFFFMPPNGTEVWVEFEAGDRNRPIWTGFLWPKGRAPAKSPDEMVLATPSGTVTFDAKNEKGSVAIKTERLSVELSDGTVTIIADGKGKIEVTSGGDVTATSGGTGKVEIKSSGTNINGTSLEVT